MSKPRIAIIVGSIRPNRFADKPAEWIEKIARDRGDMDVEVLDLKEFDLPMFAEEKSPAWGRSSSEAGRRWQEKVDGFDGYLILAAEYNRGPTAVLKNALDYAYKEWNRKPVAFVGYGGVGGARAVEQLRLNAVELQMAPTRSAVHIQWADMSQVMEGKKQLSEFEHLNGSARGVLDELAWWARALKQARERDAAAKQAA